MRIKLQIATFLLLVVAMTTIGRADVLSINGTPNVVPSGYHTLEHPNFLLNPSGSGTWTGTMWTADTNGNWKAIDCFLEYTDEGLFEVQFMGTDEIDGRIYQLIPSPLIDNNIQLYVKNDNDPYISYAQDMKLELTGTGGTGSTTAGGVEDPPPSTTQPATTNPAASTRPSPMAPEMEKLKGYVNQATTTGGRTVYEAVQELLSGSWMGIGPAMSTAQLEQNFNAGNAMSWANFIHGIATGVQNGVNFLKPVLDRIKPILTILIVFLVAFHIVTRVYQEFQNLAKRMWG